MTMELNMRRVSQQADRLEEDLKALVLCTSTDQKFRRTNEARLDDIWREILAVKSRMAEVGGKQDNAKADLERCRQEAARAMEQIKQEMTEFKSACDSVKSLLAQLPSPAEVALFTAGSHDQSSDASQEHSNNTLRPAQSSKQPDHFDDESQQAATTEKRQLRSTARQAIRARIQETLNSTRRWNRDHKATPFKDGVFVSRYLRQQSKRDPRMAVLIQKSIHKRVSSRRPRAKSRPESLEDFCEDVKWSDVIETVEEELVRSQESTVKALL
jgi:hypothetical protein